MATIISKFITKTLCDNEGCLEFRTLEGKISEFYTVAEPILRSVLFDEEKIAIRRGREEASAGQIISPDSLVLAKTSLWICQKRAGECTGCEGLHLCKFYVCGACMFGHKCKNPHDVASPYNAEVLKRHGLHELTDKQLFQLLLQNDAYLLPEICSHYNKGNGEHGSCKFSTSCKNLHICQHYLQGDCKFGSSCKRAHSIDGQGVEVLHGLSPENVRILLKSYQNNFIIMNHQAQPPFGLPALPEVRNQTCQSLKSSTRSSTSSAATAKPIGEAERNEICIFFIRGECSYKGKCLRVHYHLPYRWQVLDSDHFTWKDLPNMEDIEKAYCDPTCDTSRTDQPSPSEEILKRLSLQSKQPVDFLTMTYGGSPVRRLSTASSVSKLPHFILTTQWRWYWKDDSGTWIEFGQDDGGKSGPPSSQTLEKIYLADKETEINFMISKHQYILYLKDPAGSQQMYQQNVKYKTKHEVRRRPHFVSARDVEVKLESVPPTSSTSQHTGTKMLCQILDIRSFPK
ncbi:protein mono-ADP-ribosyltransferase PARP12 [Thalassophryne amazonica]|uniref:protein mono-ADP-ribosyltransferase PARP12 n=1 Tax=Thalassophryne amazonica TaxID=390379 RepID=UPI001471556E|nr:protein mono-ADP-ribosyltransferase PARP12 [Thalassophryne amazonica]